jgi:hypothetical protein
MTAQTRFPATSLPFPARLAAATRAPNLPGHHRLARGNQGLYRKPS